LRSGQSVSLSCLSVLMDFAVIFWVVSCWHFSGSDRVIICISDVDYSGSQRWQKLSVKIPTTYCSSRSPCLISLSSTSLLFLLSLLSLAFLPIPNWVPSPTFLTLPFTLLFILSFLQFSFRSSLLPIALLCPCRRYALYRMPF